MKVPFIACLLLLLGGCSLQKDFDYQSTSDLIAVNGFLHPDSTISIRITRPAPFPAGDTFLPLEGALVELYENDHFLSQIPYSPSKQAYCLMYLPKENAAYRLVVKVSPEDSLEAYTSVPANSSAQACYSPFPNGSDPRFNGKIKVNATIIRNDPQSVTWLGVTSKRFKTIRTQTFPSQRTDSTTIETQILSGLYSTSAVIDPFNGYRDEGFNGYDFYLRLDPARRLEEYQLDIFSFETDKFFPYRTMLSLHDSLGLFVHVYSASPEYDRYWKNALISYLNSNLEAGTPNPFAEQIVNYSNVKGGTGVFAGYNSRTIGVHQYRCQ